MKAISIKSFEFIYLTTDENCLFVTHEASTENRVFRSTEVLTIEDGKVVEAEVYFGWNVPHEAPAGGFVDKR